MYEVWTRPGIHPFDIWLLVFAGFLMVSGLVAIGLYFRILFDEKADEKDDLDEQCRLLCNEYIASLSAYLINQGRMAYVLPPDHDLMRAVEEAMGAPIDGADDFRQAIRAYIGVMIQNNESFRWDSHLELAQALRTVVLEHDHMERLGLLTP